MLKILNKNREQLSIIENPISPVVLETLNTIGEFSFSLPTKQAKEIELEGYVQIEGGQEYVVKEKVKHGQNTEIVCMLNIEEIVGMAYVTFISTENNVGKTAEMILDGTRWRVDNQATDKSSTRNLYGKVTNSYNLLVLMCTVFDVEVEFDTYNKIVKIVDRVGTDRGTYFINDLNLKKVTHDTHTHKYITRVIPVGKDGLTIESVNGGKNYLENTTYSNKVIYGIWQSDKHDNAQKLKDDAQRYLDEMAVPYETYEVSVEDLYKVRGNEVFKYGIGDLVTLIDSETETRIEQRIIQREYDKFDPTKDIIKIATAGMTFQEYYKRLQTIADMTESVIGTDGTISEGAIGDSSIGENHIKIESILAQHIKANQIQAHHLVANSITAGHIQADSIDTKHLKANIIQSEHIQTGSITAGSGIIADGAIGSAQISTLDAGKISSGTIDTSRVEVAGANSSLLIRGNRLQVFEGVGSSKKERVSLGDVDNDGTHYGLRVRGKDGKTVLYDENGVYQEGITDGSINNDKISDDANIDGAKIDINSVVRRINTDGTEVIQGTKVQVGDTKLDVKLNQITNKQTEDSNKITQNTTNITANTNAIKLKVDEQTYTTDKTNMTNTLNKHTTEISQMKDSISLKAEKTEVTKEIITAVDGIEIGGRNLQQKGAYTISANTILLNDGYSIEYTTNVLNQGIKTATNHILATGETYTLSYRLKKISGDVINVGGHSRHTDISFYLDGIKLNSRYHNGHNIDLADNQEVEVKYTFVANDYSTGVDRNIGIEVNRYTADTPKTARILVTKMKLEKGNKATDWTPAPEDVSSEITTKITEAKAEIKIETDKISSNVSTAQITANNAMSKATSVEQTASQIQNTVSHIQGDYVGQSQMTQTVNGWEYKLSSTGSYNHFKFNVNWESLSGGATYLKDGGFNFGNSKGFRLLGTGNSSVRLHNIIDKAGIYSISFYAKATNGNIPYIGIDLNDHEAGSVYLSTDWKFYKFENINVTRAGGVYDFLDIVFYHDGYNVPWSIDISELMINEGSISQKYVPNPCEVYNNITYIDREGVKVTHDRGSFSRLNSKEFYQANENSERTLSIRYGGTRYYKWEHNKAFLGGTSATRTSGTDDYAITTFGTGHANRLFFGFANDYWDDGQATSINAWMTMDRPDDCIKLYKKIGTSINMSSNNVNYNHQIYETEGKLGLFGNDGIKLGVRVGADNYKNIEITESSSSAKGLMSSWGDWHFNYWTMYNMKQVNAINAQSTYLKSRTKDINEVYGVNSFTDGEIRYSDRKEYYTTNSVEVENNTLIDNEKYTCYVEIPQILAENIELDYHINISKLSWGDYRVVEKDPYYFILESEKPNFRFTFEVVAKQIEKPHGFAKIANIQYEIEKGENSCVEDEVITGHSKYAFMDDEEIEEELYKEYVEELKRDNKLWELYGK